MKVMILKNTFSQNLKGFLGFIVGKYEPPVKYIYKQICFLIDVAVPAQVLADYLAGKNKWRWDASSSMFVRTLTKFWKYENLDVNEKKHCNMFTNVKDSHKELLGMREEIANALSFASATHLPTLNVIKDDLLGVKNTYESHDWEQD